MSGTLADKVNTGGHVGTLADYVIGVDRVRRHRMDHLDTNGSFETLTDRVEH